MSSKNVQRHTKATKQKFEVLGRFVQAFELMVDSVRRCCLTLAQPANDFQGRALKILLNHQSLSAQPLWEVMRALLFEVLNDKTNKFKVVDQDVARGLVNQIAVQWPLLTQRRNDLLHGTWRLGREGSLNDEALAAIRFTKYKVTKAGLQKAPPPKDIAEMSGLIRQCEDIEHLMIRLDTCLAWGFEISKNFRRIKGEWKAIDL